MAYNPSPRNLLRARILQLPLFGEQRLVHTVRVVNNSMLGHGDLCEFLSISYPSVAFSWIPLMSCLCIFCPDANVSGCILADVRSRFNVEPINRTVK